MEDKKIKYYKLCEEAKKYGEEFFKELCVSCSNPAIIKDDILPLVFTDIKDYITKSVQDSIISYITHNYKELQKRGIIYD